MTKLIVNVCRGVQSSTIDLPGCRVPHFTMDNLVVWVSPVRCVGNEACCESWDRTRRWVFNDCNYRARSTGDGSATIEYPLASFEGAKLTFIWDDLLFNATPGRYTATIRINNEEYAQFEIALCEQHYLGGSAQSTETHAC